ncbi:MAG TPA: hypothetical protein VNK25_03605 [Candidatus Nitrosotenuis sp.]|jgi:hypothetical protein|nr:hypothetical protein [Candidatus Nitrosotenuis sp.]
MNRKLATLLAVAITIAALVVLVSAPSEKSQRQEVYHVRLADPKLYQDGFFADTFAVKKGTYQFRFVPNGDSPQILSIALMGPTFSFAEDFKLQGTPHETGISTYYTWEYLGQNTIKIPEDQELQIIINPHGNTLGPVSVYLVE